MTALGRRGAMEFIVSTVHYDNFPTKTFYGFQVQDEQDRAAIVEDTYAEAFRSIYAEFLITARDRTWLDHCTHAATGHASSTILCDSEAGVS